MASEIQTECSRLLRACVCGLLGDKRRSCLLFSVESTNLRAAEQLAIYAQCPEEKKYIDT